MGGTSVQLPIGRQVSLPGHFDLPVTLESARPLRKGFECRVRLHDGTLDEAVISEEEAAALTGSTPAADSKTPLANADHLRLLIESARIRLAYAHSDFAERGEDEQLSWRPAPLLARPREGKLCGCA
jgi:hypothetical protein